MSQERLKVKVRRFEGWSAGHVSTPLPDGWSEGDVAAEVRRVFRRAEMDRWWPEWLLPYGELKLSWSEGVWTARLMLRRWRDFVGRGTLSEALEGARDAFLEWVRGS